MSWNPVRTLAQTEAILCAPGKPHELDTKIIDGCQYRIYKNLWPSIRQFWLSCVDEHADKIHIVYEDQRFSYREIHERALKVAGIFQHEYDIRKGDRVGICSRNCPDYLVSFWACHLIGAVTVLTNAWLPLQPLRFCHSHTECKLIIVDPQRADQFEPVVAEILRDTAATGFLVFDSHEGKGMWKGMQCFRTVVNNYHGDSTNILKNDPGIVPEDNAAVMFTSGTTGLPKGVLSTHRQFLTNVLNVVSGGARATLRTGGDYPLPPPEGPQKGVLVAVPLFHVTGTTSFSMMSAFTGMKIVLVRKWDPEEAVRLIKQEKISIAGGVPSMVADLIESSLVGYPIDNLLFGGSPAPDALVPRARNAFPTASMSQAYGMTETNSVSVSFAGEDYIARPASTGIPCPVNEVKIIISEDQSVPPGNVGEVWLRGPNVMKCYWRDPDATKKVLMDDGWLRTGDLGMLDDEGFLYIKDRLKDIIIRGGENVDSVSVENSLYSDPRVSEAAAVGVPDERLGEQVAAVVTLKPAYQGRVTEADLIAMARHSLPRFAVPVMIVIQHQPLERNPAGKILKPQLRQLARRHWEDRHRKGTSIEPSTNL